MKFKVGQRVRLVYREPGVKCGPTLIPIGTEGTIVSLGYPLTWNMRWDGYGERHSNGRRFGANECSLAPLTDPGFESFMERIQKPLTKPEWEAA